MNTNRRYTFWKVFWIVTAVYLFFFALALIGMFITPMANKDVNWEAAFSLKKFVSAVYSIVFFSLFYYITVNKYYKRIAEHKPFPNFIQPTVLAFVLMIMYYAISFIFFDKAKIQIAINEGKSSGELTTGVFIFAYTISSMFITGFALLFSYLTYLRDERKQRKILEEQKMQLEVEKSTANFNFLKAQINPHFLHNTLNFLYAKSLPYSPELSEGILTLSDIMRYALSEGNAKDGKAPLKDEIEHVRNVIKINQLRFSNNLNVHFDVEGVVNGATIIPFVLITLVENAFKHGDLKDTQHPIDIHLKVEGKRLVFYCRNKKKTGPKEISTGIGLDNIKKRLDLAYGKDYALNVKDEAEFYTTELIINDL